MDYYLMRMILLTLPIFKRTIQSFNPLKEVNRYSISGSERLKSILDEFGIIESENSWN